MKVKSYLILALSILLFDACSKDAAREQPVPQHLNFKNGLLNFSANGQLVNTIIDTNHNTILVITKDTIGQSKVAITFTLQSQASASINNQVVNSGATVNLTGPLSFTVTSADKSRSTTFKLASETEIGYIGMPGRVTAENNLDKHYNFYFDQFDGYLAINQLRPDICYNGYKMGRLYIHGQTCRCQEHVPSTGWLVAYKSGSRISV